MKHFTIANIFNKKYWISFEAYMWYSDIAKYIHSKHGLVSDKTRLVLATNHHCAKSPKISLYGDCQMVIAKLRELNSLFLIYIHCLQAAFSYMLLKNLFWMIAATYRVLWYHAIYICWDHILKDFCISKKNHNFYHSLSNWNMQLIHLFIPIEIESFTGTCDAF